MWPFKKKATDPVGMEKGLDSYARSYRQQRIHEIARLTEKTYEDARVLADKWIVHTSYLTVGNDPEKLVYTPSPIWDDEWMLHRAMFDTEGEAREHVAERGGTLLVSS